MADIYSDIKELNEVYGRVNLRKQPEQNQVDKPVSGVWSILFSAVRAFINEKRR
jgi:hypothetical protein